MFVVWLDETYCVPLSTIRIASLVYGMSSRLTINPGVSLHDTVTFPIALPHAFIASKVASEVSGMRITSRSFIKGTGLKKWSPPKRSFLFVFWAISLIGIEDVLLAKRVFEGATYGSGMNGSKSNSCWKYTKNWMDCYGYCRMKLTLSMSAKSFCLGSKFSIIASTTRSASETALWRSVVYSMRDRVPFVNSSAFVGSF